MKKCDVCGGAYEGKECPFVQGEGLPWEEDYALMGKGKMEHKEHQSNVARWVLHGVEEHSESVINWARERMQNEKM